MNDNWPPLVVGFIAFLVVSWVIGFSMGEKKTQQEAVRANVAEWIVDQDGYVKFKFKQ